MLEAYTRNLWVVMDSEGDSVADVFYESREEAEKEAAYLAKEDAEYGPFTVYALIPTVYFVRGQIKRVPVCRETLDHA